MNGYRLAKLKVCNLGCIGSDGVEITLDEIVCLVGANNSGKSTMLRAYELAATSGNLKPEEIFTRDITLHPTFVKQEATVELWVHIPEGAENIDRKWVEVVGTEQLVRSKWTWPIDGGKPNRTTWDPLESAYAENGKGLSRNYFYKLA